MVQLLRFAGRFVFWRWRLCSAAIVAFVYPGFGTVSPWRRHHARRITRAIMPGGITLIVTRSPACRARVALGARRGANAGAAASPMPMPASRRAPMPAAWRHRAASFGSSNVVAEARRYLGGNPTGRGSLWCARFMNMVLQHSGHHGTGSDMASSFASYGQRISGPQVGAIAVMGRRGGGHVGIITGIDASGNPILISGNNGNRVREAADPARPDLRLCDADELKRPDAVKKARCHRDGSRPANCKSAPDLRSGWRHRRQCAPSVTTSA